MAVKKERTLSYNGLTGTLHIRQDGNEDGYYLDLVDCGHENSFTLTKIIPPTDRTPRAYGVVIGPDADYDDCSCPGFRRHRRCKHSAALRCLRGLGRV